MSNQGNQFFSSSGGRHSFCPITFLFCVDSSTWRACRAHVRFAETLDPTDGNVYHFELFPEFTGVEPDFGMVFGDMSDMADDERVKFNFRMYASGRYYNWHAVNGAWKHGVSGTRVTANGTLTIRRLTCRTETSPTTGH